jgi:4-carboxymuconolactone decarboxylase
MTSVEDAPEGSLVADIFARSTAETGIVPLLYQCLAGAPKLLDAWVGYAWALRADAVSDRGLRELGVLRMAQLAGSDYVWRSHYKVALKSGCSQESVDHLGDWATADVHSPAERAVLTLADAMAAGAQIGDDALAGLQEQLSDEEVIDVVLTLAWYLCVGRVVGALGVPLEAHHAKVRGVDALSSPRRDGPRARGSC